jgi:hypothetical protein
MKAFAILSAVFALAARRASAQSEAPEELNARVAGAEEISVPAIRYKRRRRRKLRSDEII